MHPYEKSVIHEKKKQVSILYGILRNKGDGDGGQKIMLDMQKRMYKKCSRDTARGVRNMAVMFAS